MLLLHYFKIIEQPYNFSRMFDNNLEKHNHFPEFVHYVRLDKFTHKFYFFYVS